MKKRGRTQISKLTPDTSNLKPIQQKEVLHFLASMVQENVAPPFFFSKSRLTEFRTVAKESCGKITPSQKIHDKIQPIMQKILIKKTHPDATVPHYQTPGSAAFDFHLIEDVEIPPHSVEKVRTGLVIQTPKNHVLLIPTRSSSPLKKGITAANGVAVIDSDYRGPEDEIFLLIQNITDAPTKLQKGDRVAQGLIVPVIQVEFEEAENLEDESRGGHGSTGR